MSQQLSSNDAIPRRHRGIRWRLWVLLLIGFAVVVLISWRRLLPETAQSISIPQGLTDQDKKEIVALCRRHTIGFCLQRLRRADFGWFVRGVHVLFQQKIDRFFDDRNGTFRVYVVVYDKQAPDGFNPWSRHQVTKTNGHWTILRSY